LPGPKLEIGKEYPPEGESGVIEQLRALHLKVHQAQPGPSHRGEHPKQHAGLWATFRVEKDVPERMRVGLFAAPRRYTALVRFSNGRGPDDTKPEAPGMAVKVLVPDGDGPLRLQDFILADHPVFFARDAPHTFEFLVATVKGTPALELAATDYRKLVGFTSVARASLLDMTYIGARLPTSLHATRSSRTSWASCRRSLIRSRSTSRRGGAGKPRTRRTARAVTMPPRGVAATPRSSTWARTRCAPTRSFP
jgi:hypothetical protein